MALVKTIEMSIVADPGDARGVLGDLTAQGDELRKPITMVLTADSAEAQEQVDTLAEAEERAAAATDAVVDAQARLAEVQADGAATADDLAAAQERVEDALVRNIATQDELTAAQLRNADAARVEGDAQEELAVKEDTAGDAAAGAGEKFKLGSMAMLGVVAAIAGIGYESVKMAVNFQSSMETLVTQAGVPKSALAGLKTGVLALAGQVGFSPDSLAEALYHVESSFASVGIKGPQALNLLKIAAEGAAVGHADLTDVTNALDATIVAGVPGIKSYSGAMGALNAIVGSGDMTMQNLADALGTGVMAVAKSFGQNIYQVGAALAVLGDNNIRGAKAATDLRMAWQAVQAPLVAGIPVLQKLGLTSTELASTMEHHGLSQAIVQFIAHLKESKVPVSDWGQYMTEIFGKKAGVGIGILTDQIGRLQSKFPDLEHGASGFGSAWAATKQTVSVEVKQVEGAFDSLMITIGDKVLPVASEFLGFLLRNRGPVLAFAGAFGTLVAALALFTVTTRIAGAAMAILDIEMDANPIGLVVVAVAALVIGLYELYKHFRIVREAVADVASFFAGAWRDAMHLAGEAVKWFDDGPLVWIRAQMAVFAAWWKQNGAEITKIWTVAWDLISDYVRINVEIIKTVVKVGMDILTSELKAGWDVISGIVKMAWDVIAIIVSTNIHVILDIISAVLDIIQGHWSAAGHQLENATSAIWHEVISIIRTVTSGFGSILWNAGSALIGGLIGGIKSAVGGLMSTVSGLAGDVSSAFGAALKIFSPSRVFREHGHMIVEGLRLGIEDYAPGAVGAADRLASMVSAGAAGAGGHGGGGGGTVVNVNFNGVVGDPQAVARQIQQLLLTLSRSKGFRPNTSAGLGLG